MTHPPAHLDDPSEPMPARLLSLLDRMGPIPYRRGTWRCSRCGEVSAAAEDLRSGLFLEGTQYVRRHPPRLTIRCLIPSCRHTEVVDWQFAPVAGPPAMAEGERDEKAAIPASVVALLRPMPPGGGLPAPQRPGADSHPAGVPPPPGGMAEDAAAAAWRRVHACLRHLFEALADLDEAGGMAAAAAALGWKRRRWAKHLGLLGLVHRMIAGAMRRGRDGRDRP